MTIDLKDDALYQAAKRTALEKKSAADLMAANWKVDDEGNFDISRKEYGDYTTTMKEADEAKAFVQAVEANRSFDAYFDAAPVPEAAMAAAAAANGGGGEFKTLADIFIEGKQFQAARERGSQGGNPWFDDVQSLRGSLEGKSIHALSAGTFTAQSLGTVQHQGITERALRKTRIRDLFPKSSTKASVLHGVQETGWVNNAKQVRQRYAADGVSPATGADTDVWGWKPKSKIQLKTVMFPVATIAHTLDAHKNILDDEPRLRTFLNNRMAEGVKYAEDFDLLHSVGGANSEEITGLFNTTGVQEYPGEAADKYSVQVRRAITKAQLAEYDPSGLVVSPTMWEAIEVEEDDYGSFRVAVNVAIGAVKQVWHLDVVSTTAMSDENFLIGSFGLGAQLHDREQVNVIMSTENGTNVEHNLVTFRAEERIALEVVRPESFVIGEWTTPA